MNNNTNTARPALSCQQARRAFCESTDREIACLAHIGGYRRPLDIAEIWTAPALRRLIDRGLATPEKTLTANGHLVISQACAALPRRTAYLFINAARGDANAARRLLGDAIRATLAKAKRQDVAPHFVSYSRAGKEDPREPAHFTLLVTDAEFTALMAAVGDGYEAGGWTGKPFDCLHD